jgi:hypothetical protein
MTVVDTSRGLTDGFPLIQSSRVHFVKGERWIRENATFPLECHGFDELSLTSIDTSVSLVR